ncbi:hypothetical protein FV222_24890 [Methylobacterium sp. WL103]|uniref:PIN domain-containing protein n=1 Tax=unclassified Methylobacterium TaxID=2615210 RepID=UPI0011CB9D77|nr:MULTISPECIES: PIN domain-containing protein [unclassified Methylobacterium]TXM67111.1 hypothetical protein FV226_22460 [Methylobacterium sp. WL12]TXM90932.1 hypothetical protein FV222_24890 [Methylobacterium sp. WL103]
MRRVLAIDTNLLVLLIVGTASPSFIGRHKRTQTYTVEDFQLLLSLIAAAESCLFTPHVLAETSNLVRQFGKPGLTDILNVFCGMVERTREVQVRGLEAVRRPEFAYLGLTDAGLLTVDAGDVTLLTDDFDLYRASLSAGRRPINFSHQREVWLGV